MPRIVALCCLLAASPLLAACGHMSAGTAEPPCSRRGFRNFERALDEGDRLAARGDTAEAWYRYTVALSTTASCDPVPVQAERVDRALAYAEAYPRLYAAEILTRPHAFTRYIDGVRLDSNAANLRAQWSWKHLD